MAGGGVDGGGLCVLAGDADVVGDVGGDAGRHAVEHGGAGQALGEVLVGQDRRGDGIACLKVECECNKMWKMSAFSCKEVPKGMAACDRCTYRTIYINQVLRCGVSQ